VVEALTVRTQILVPVARHFSSYFRTPPRFSKGSVVVDFVLSVRDTFYSLSVILGHGAGSVNIADHQYEEHVLFVSNQIYY